MKTHSLPIFIKCYQKTLNVYPENMYEKYILLNFHFLNKPKPKQVRINETTENNLSFI